MDHQSFTLRFIDDLDNSKKDVVIKVFPSDSTFTWSYKHKNSGEHYLHLKLQASYERMDSILTMVQYDTDEPSKVQVDIPGYPQILMTFSNFVVMKPRILESFLATMRDWPKRLNRCECKHEKPDDIWKYDNSDALSVVSSSDTMPPLVSVSQYGDF